MSASPVPRDILEAAFPPDLVKSRPGAFGGSLQYLEGHTVIARLNEAFDSGWSFEIERHEILPEEVIVLGRLRVDRFEIVKMAFGGSRITRDKLGAATAIGDDLKSAATDALKKASTLLGVGLQLYGATTSTVESDAAEPPRTPTPVSRHDGAPATRHVIRFSTPSRTAVPESSKNSAPEVGNGEAGPGRITGKQLAAIFAIARDRRMSNSDVRDLCKSKYNRVPDYLSKAEASALIEHLLAQ